MDWVGDRSGCSSENVGEWKCCDLKKHRTGHWGLDDSSSTGMVELVVGFVWILDIRVGPLLIEMIEFCSCWGSGEVGLCSDSGLKR